MANPLRGGLTIRQWMGLIGGFAIGYALVTSVRVGPILAFLLLPTVLVVAVASLALHSLYSPVLGAGCPYCGGLTLERRSVSSFGNRFYQCSKCGVRCMRVALGGWRDASGSEYDRRYGKKRGGDPWSAAPGLEDEDLIASKTHNNLVQSKRNRRPENPNGPGLE